MVKEKATPNHEEGYSSSKLSKLIVYNDNYNTFDHVIDTLIEVCNHNPEQAEQCTLVIHHKGKCTVKLGEAVDLADMCKKIIERKITATIEQ